MQNDQSLAVGQTWTPATGTARRITGISHDGLVSFLLLPGGKVTRYWGYVTFLDWVARTGATPDCSSDHPQGGPDRGEARREGGA